MQECCSTYSFLTPPILFPLCMLHIQQHPIPFSIRDITKLPYCLSSLQTIQNEMNRKVRFEFATLNLNDLPKPQWQNVFFVTYSSLYFTHLCTGYRWTPDWDPTLATCCPCCMAILASRPLDLLLTFVAAFGVHRLYPSIFFYE